MTAPTCSGQDDGLHRWRYGVSRMAGTPRYACDSCHVIALPTGDGVAEDYAYLGASGVVVRDDGRRPYVVHVPASTYVEVHVLATDGREAAERAMTEAEDILQRAADRVADYGVTIGGADYPASVAGWSMA
jgi:hypothetical protein